MMFQLLIATALAASNVCAPTHVADCKALKGGPANLAGQLGFPAAQDGTVFFNFAGPMARSSPDDFIHPLNPKDESFLDSMAVLTPARRKRTLETFERVRREAIELVRGDVRNDQLSAAQRAERDALIKRLETVQPHFADAESKTCAETSMRMPNAGYMRASHSIDICPATAAVSTQALISTFTHEFGHVIEPCASSATLYRVQSQGDMREALRQCDSSFIPSEDDQGRDPSITPLVYDALKRLQSETASERLDYMEGDEETIRQLASCGILKPVAGSDLNASTLFSETESCIERQSAATYQQQFDALVQSLEGNGQSRANAQAMVKRDEPAKCFGRSREYFADTFSARLMGKIAETDRYSEQSTRGMLLTAAAWGCLAQAGSDQDLFAYPPSTVRFQTLVNSSYVSSHLSCEPPKAGSVCEFKSVTVSGGTPHAASPQTNRARTSH